MKAGTFRLYQGGMFRCCIQTLDTEEVDQEPDLGSSIECRFCKAILMYEDGWDGPGWVWIDPEEVRYEPEEDVIP